MVWKATRQIGCGIAVCKEGQNGKAVDHWRCGSLWVPSNTTNSCWWPRAGLLTECPDALQGYPRSI
jgi:hypothetical protein